MTPTGGPNRCSTIGLELNAKLGRRRAPRAVLRFGAWCAALSHLSCLSWLLLASPAWADAPLRITGNVTIDANASLQHGSSDLQARLLDDAGHAVTGAELRIKPALPSSATTQTWSARDCRAHAPEVSANAEGAYVAHTDGSGALCVHFDGLPEHAEFDLSFSDPNGLYAAVERHVVADSASRGVEMAFAPAPSLLSLERETQILSLVTRPVPAMNSGEAAERLGISVALKRDGGAVQKLAEGSVELGGSLEFRIPSRAFGAPGALELSAEFPGSVSTRASRAVAHVTCTAEAVLSLAEPIAASRTESGVQVRVRVDSVAGPVPSGSVEAQSGGASLGSARVTDGLANLYLQLDEALAKSGPLTLRYVADTPWWLPARPLAVQIPILPPSQWHRLAWIAGAVALSAWLLISWQRPRRLERSAPVVQRPAVRAPIDVIEVGDLSGGWRGHVLDAHDGSPIGAATVLLRLPAFDGKGVLRTTQSANDGSFAIEGIPNAGPGAALEVRAAWHTALAAPMPPPGNLVLSLVSRRRTLLGRFAGWARGDAEWGRRREPTPGEVARHAARAEVSTWARAVDEAAFGPDPLSEAKEQAVVGREPPQGGKVS